MKKQLFIITENGISNNYGIGTYVSELITDFTKAEYNIIIVIFNKEKERKIDVRRKGGVYYMNLFLSRTSSQLNRVTALSIYSIIQLYFKPQPNDVFHFNSHNHFSLAKYIKESIKCYIVYTIHMSLLESFYGKDYELFIREWNDDKFSSIFKFLMLQEKELCMISNRVICLNNETKQVVQNVYNVPKNKAKLVRNTIDRNNIEIEYHAKKFKKFTFLYVGRLVKEKGILELISGFMKLSKIYPKKYDLILIGNGELTSKINAIAKKYTNIKVMGYIKHSRVKYYYLKSHCFISLSHSEQCSYTVTEAINYGLPLILSGINSFQYIRQSGYEYFNISFDDKCYNDYVNDVKNKMIEVLNDKNLDRFIQKANVFFDKNSKDKLLKQTYKI
ncbi:hypothetical protein CMU93_03085 [Elizabethkingia anophelis]|nr:hypothetical protein [Elizabethkingia anophelis]